MREFSKEFPCSGRITAQRRNKAEHFLAYASHRVSRVSAFQRALSSWVRSWKERSYRMERECLEPPMNSIPFEQPSILVPLSAGLTTMVRLMTLGRLLPADTYLSA